MGSAYQVLSLLVFLYLAVCIHTQNQDNSNSEGSYEGKLVKGNRNAIFLVKKGYRKAFPDFNTFAKMGYDANNIIKIRDDILNSIPLGETIPSIPVFRPDDYMYHAQCEDPDRMVNDLGLVPNMGNFANYISVLKRVKTTKKLELLALGGSITAGGYFMEFVRNLRENEGLDVTVHNHGHGATEITYTIFCVDIEKYSPDLVLIDFSVNDYGHPKLMDALLRKVLMLKSRPIVAIVNLWGSANCPVPRYLLHSFYYQIPLIAVCPAVNLCYGKHHLPKFIYEQYSKTDGVHPWGSNGVKFLGDILFAWWKKLHQVATNDVTMDLNGKMVTHTHSFDESSSSSSSGSSERGKSAAFGTAPSADHQGLTGFDTSIVLPPPLYVEDPIGLCTRCDALVEDADGKLTPYGEVKGFRTVTRMKIGYGGFTANKTSTATKSFKKSFQADTPGSTISFKFYGSSVKIAIWQRRDSMGVIHAYVDNDKSKIAKASGFFKGYTWAMERNNTGRSEIMPLFEGLEDKEHVLTLVVSDEPANVWVKGHLAQVFALLSASDNLKCKTVKINA